MTSLTLDKTLTDGNTLLIEGPLRSGRRIAYDGNVVVMGDVNAGAEVTAGGHIIIFGALRGMVHGGSNGREDAKVLALSLYPTQLRIAGHITCPPDGYEKMGMPEIAHIKAGKVVIEQYEW